VSVGPCRSDTMSEAFETVCRSLGTQPGHYASELIAAKVMELGQDGVSDSEELSRRVLRSLNVLD